MRSYLLVSYSFNFSLWIYQSLPRRTEQIPRIEGVCTFLASRHDAESPSLGQLHLAIDRRVAAPLSPPPYVQGPWPGRCRVKHLLSRVVLSLKLMDSYTKVLPAERTLGPPLEITRAGIDLSDDEVVIIR